MAGRALRYGAAGLFATLVYFGVVALLVEWANFGPVPAAALGTAVVIVTSYVVNRAWVFDTTRSHVSAFSRFVIASLVSIALNTGLMYAAVHIAGWPWLTGLVLATLIVPPTNFAVNYLWCFRAGSVDR